MQVNGTGDAVPLLAFVDTGSKVLGPGPKKS
jgi:hypothetical protein